MKNCSVISCARKHQGKGYCNLHYQRWLRHGDPLTVVSIQLPKNFYKECTVSGCNKKPHGKGLCDAHGKLAMRKKTPEYSVWQDIKRRCYNPNFRQYDDWGGRGIKVCDRWKNSFTNFYEDMGKRPSKDHSIERKDVNGDYEPSNCVWATDIEQANNRRNNVKVTVNGITDTISGWSSRTGLPRGMLHARYYYGWRGDKFLQPSRYKTGRHSHGRS